MSRKINYLLEGADPSVLRVVLRNLIDNAVKHTASGGKISLFTERERGGVWIRVTDTGVGISQERFRTLFEFGERSKPGTGGEQGTGLGLLLVGEWMNSHGGRVAVQSESRKGSIFSLWFPSKPEK